MGLLWATLSFASWVCSLISSYFLLNVVVAFSLIQGFALFKTSLKDCKCCSTNVECNPRQQWISLALYRNSKQVNNTYTSFVYFLSSDTFSLLQVLTLDTLYHSYDVRYLYFYEKGVTQITVASIQSLLELITTEMQSENKTADPAADALLASTLRYIQFQKDKGGAVGEKYDSIKS